MQMKQLNDLDLSFDFNSTTLDDELNETGTIHSISDALILSLANRGKVDMKYIENLTREKFTTIITALKGSIFQNPAKWNEDIYQGWETADEYLSGNLRRKLKIAKEANKKYNKRFLENTEAIKQIIPDVVSYKDIYVTLGSPWLPVRVIEDFIGYLINARRGKRPIVRHDEYTGSWEIRDKNKYLYPYSVALCNTYGTSAMDALRIIENTLNMKNISVKDRFFNPVTKKYAYKQNKEETLLAIEKQKQIIEIFKEWIWQDDERREDLEKIFDAKYACVKKRIFDGSFLRFPNLSEKVTLFPYQKDAVARIIFSPNTLLAHDVGCGKTYIMIAAGMELKRMGLSKKNLYVVPNNIVSQWHNHFLELYPNANLFCVDAKQFTPEKKDETLATIRDQEFDAIIMGYSCFDRIDVSQNRLLKELEDAEKQVASLLKYYKLNTKELRLEKTKLDKKIKTLKQKITRDNYELYFDNLGIDRLFVDEAHNYKNVTVDTNCIQVYGVSKKGSKKCDDMLEKVKFIQSKNDGGGVVMATGTPITNSLTDAYVMQLYLQSGELALLDLHTFDNWTQMFAEKVTEFEIDIDTNSYRLATRFSKFHNLPELTALLSSIADFHQIDEFIELPKFEGYNDVLIEKTKEFDDFLKVISQRADTIRNRYHIDISHSSLTHSTSINNTGIKRKENNAGISIKNDNLLKITTDGRKAALDLRLVDSSASFTDESKVSKCANNVYQVYLESEKMKGTQLVFCDTSTPKNTFNIYDEVKELLLKKGIKEKEIAYIHDATNDAKRESLFKKIRKGDIRILIGSTFKLGTGVNIQDRLIAIHHLDVPWRPSDMVQREGRILRQGNLNEKVYIYRYITKGSFDAYSWQILQSKQKFIDKLLEGSIIQRSDNDISNTELSYAEVKALAIGNPKIKERVEIENELSRQTTLLRKEKEAKQQLRQSIIKLTGDINYKAELSIKCLDDANWYDMNKEDHDKKRRAEIRQKLEDAINESFEKPKDVDTTIMVYQGFEIILPSNMYTDKRFLMIRHNGKYTIELGESSSGAIVRIDNFLENLKVLHKESQKEIKELKKKKDKMKEEASKESSYSEKIEELVEKLQELDKKLGVKK